MSHLRKAIIWYPFIKMLNILSFTVFL